MRTILKTISVLAAAATFSAHAVVVTHDFNSGLPANSALFSNGVAPGPSVAATGGVGDSGVLKLTEAVNGNQGSWVLNDINSGVPITNFVVRYKARVGGGTATPADGYSFSFGADIPDASWGEEGAGTGITVSFDTYINGEVGETNRHVEVKFGGVVVAHAPFDVSSGANFIDMAITLCANGRVTVVYGTQTIINRAQTGYIPVVGRFGFGARTGGLNDNHWIDDLSIDTSDPAAVAITGQPATQSINEGQSATFTIAVNGICYNSVQWFRDGAPITGANSLSYTFGPAAVADSGAVFRAEVTDGFGTVVSDNATLTVIPAPTLIAANSRNNPGGIFVFFSRDMDATTALNVANYTVDNGVTVSSAAFNTIVASNGPQSVVLLGTSPLTAGTTYTVSVANVQDTASNVINPNPSVKSFVQAAGPQTICYDFNSGLPVGSQLYSNPVAPWTTRIDAGILKLTDAANSQNGAFLSPVLSAAPVGGFTARFRAQVNSPQANPADGFSFNFANDLPATVYAVAEEGAGTGVTIAFDNWDSGGAEAPAMDLKWNGAVIASRKIPKHNAARFIEFILSARADGTMDLFVDGTNVFANVASGFRGIANGRVGFAGRTGGANENHWIDDFCFTVDAGPVVLATEPVSQTVAENQIVTFSVTATGGSPRYYQWMENGAPIPGANGQTYSFVATPGHNNNTYSVTVNNEFSSATSSNAVLTVITDVVAPTVVSVNAAPGGTNLVVVFSEPVSITTATNFEANYSLDGGSVFIIGATLAPDLRTVVLATDDLAPLSPGSPHSLSIQGITDRSAAANVLTPNPTVVNFTAWHCNIVPGQNVVREIYRGLQISHPNNLGKLTNNAKYPGSPDTVDTLATFESPQSAPDEHHYGVRLTSYLVPTESGPHQFELLSDDASLLSLSTDANPANARVVVREDACCVARVSGIVNLVAGQAYWMQGLMEEGAGGDRLRVQWRTPSTISGPFALIPSANLLICVNPDVTTLAVAQNPASAVVDQSRSVSFSALVTGAAGITYQWERSDDGGTTWTPISGATRRTYTIANASLGDNNAQFRAVATVLGIPAIAVPTGAATLTVTPDATRPVVTSVVGRGNSIGLCFSEVMDNSLLVVSDSFSYNLFINGTQVQVTNAIFRADGKSVELQFDAVSSVSGQPYTVQVSTALTDLAGNAVAEDPSAPGSNFSAPIVGQQMLSVADLNLPVPATTITGMVYTCNNTDFTVTTGGADIWGNNDQGTFVYSPMAGDFDVRVRVDRLDLTVGGGNRWSKAGLNIRENLQAGGTSGAASRMVWLYPTPTNHNVNPTGANAVEFGVRHSPGAGVTDINVPAATFPRPPVDNFPIWVRVKRAGEAFAGFYSRDGMNWLRTGPSVFTTGFPNSLLVGLATTSHFTNGTTTAEYANYGAHVNPPITVEITQQPTFPGQVTNGTAASNLTVVATITGAPASELVYQWQRSANGTGPFVNLNSVAATHVMGVQTYDNEGDTYRVLVYATGHPTLTSEVAVVSIAASELVAPSLTAARRSSIDLTQVQVQFSEAVSIPSATTPGNYSITSYDGQTITVTAAVRETGPAGLVTLTASAPLTNHNIYTLTVNNVRDLAGNVIAPNSQIQINLQGARLTTGSQNLVVAEAENYDRKVARTPAGNVLHEWVFSTARGGFSGSGSMLSLPNNNAGAPTQANGPATAASLDFCIRFPAAGTYYVWTRGGGANGSDDSSHIGINDTIPTTADQVAPGYTNNSPNNFGWSGASQETGNPRITVNVPSAGTHVIHVYMREDGLAVDKILLTTDAAYNPNTVNGGVGPAETTDRESTGPLPPRLTLSKSGSTATLSWSSLLPATLQEATTISGPWRNAANQANPQTINLPSFSVYLDGAQDGGGARTGTGSGSIQVSGNTVIVNVSYEGLSGTVSAAHIHAPAGRGATAGVLYGLNPVPAGGQAGTISQTITLVDKAPPFGTVAEQLEQLKNGLWYINIHTSPNFGGGEIRGQVDPAQFFRVVRP